MSFHRPPTRWLLATFAAVVVPALILAQILNRPNASEPLLLESVTGATPHVKLASYDQGGTPSLKGGVAWINSGPITLSELHGKIVLLDFWTFCCINCHHILPDLAKLEEKYKDELVVIGVHTAKFEAERDTENIRRKVREYRITHPVVNDANQVIWRHFGVQSWPTLILIDPNGKYLGGLSGEGHFEELDRVIGRLVQQHKARGDLNLTPLKFSPEMERPSNGPLLFPGKVLADVKGKRIFIADTGHNRIVQTDPEGHPVVIGDGEEGFEDGPFAKARFNRPQGLCVSGEVLYVADTENHAIRAVDLKEHSVATIAGIGSQIAPDAGDPIQRTGQGDRPEQPLGSRPDPGRSVALYRHGGPPPDLEARSRFVHDRRVRGLGIREHPGWPPRHARFAQPSGITTDGENLFVADSEVSGIREIFGVAAREPLVRTVVGMGLFEFGDRDGRGPLVRLQHCLGVAYGNGQLYIADTYNNKIKVCTPRTQSVKTLVGSAQAGRYRRSAPLLRAGRPKRRGLLPLRRRYEQS